MVKVRARKQKWLSSVVLGGGTAGKRYKANGTWKRKKNQHSWLFFDFHLRAIQQK